jgi:transitional endoplasmic reticulum ATPase
MEEINLLNEAFNMYYKKAKTDQENGNIELAKRNYLLAAETMFKIAKNSSKQLQKAQYDRAVRLREISENLVPAPRGKGGCVVGGAGAKAKSGETEDKKVFAAAEIPEISFDDIAGLEDVKRTITMQMLNPIKHKEKYAFYDKKTGGGVLLFGPPGTGKTMIAKAIAHEVGAKFYNIKGSDIVSKWVGESEQNINALFEQARKDERAIIFVDEMDSLFGTRGVDTHNDKRVNEFLQQIDGFAGQNPNLLLLGATNRPWDIDSAAVRSGRFSRKIYVPLPDAISRKFLFKLYTKKTPLDGGVNLDNLVAATQNFSGADIAEVCDRAKEAPLQRFIETEEAVSVSQDDFVGAIRSMNVIIDKKEIEKFEKYNNSAFPPLG